MTGRITTDYHAPDVAQHYIADVHGAAVTAKGSEDEANARLIAAAPELLTALWDVAEDLRKHINVSREECASGPLGAAYAAIARARGETP